MKGRGEAGLRRFLRFCRSLNPAAHHRPNCRRGAKKAIKAAKGAKLPLRESGGMTGCRRARRRSFACRRERASPRGPAPALGRACVTRRVLPAWCDREPVALALPKPALPGATWGGAGAGDGRRWAGSRSGRDPLLLLPRHPSGSRRLPRLRDDARVPRSWRLVRFCGNTVLAAVRQLHMSVLLGKLTCGGRVLPRLGQAHLEPFCHSPTRHGAVLPRLRHSERVRGIDHL